MQSLYFVGYVVSASRKRQIVSPSNVDEMVAQWLETKKAKDEIETAKATCENQLKALLESNLRNLFATSPSWNPDLQAIVLSGTRNRKPNSIVVSDLADKILTPAKYGCDYEKLCKINRAAHFFKNPEDDPAECIKALTDLAPKAYAPKKSLVGYSEHCATRRVLHTTQRVAIFKNCLRRYRTKSQDQSVAIWARRLR